MRILVSGGAKLDPEVSANFKTLGLPIIEGYGLTETSPIIAFNCPVNMLLVQWNLLYIQVKIVSMKYFSKGANVMKGYYNNPKATSEEIDEDGWFHMEV